MAHTRITTDASGALESLDAAVRLRAAHDSFDLALRLDDDRGSVAAILAHDICHGNRDLGSRRAALEQVGSADAVIGQNPLIGFATMDLATKATVRDLAMLAQSLVFRSWAEMRRAVMNFDILHRSYIIEASNDALVPEPASRQNPDGSVLIWAPDVPVERLYIVLTAAAETGRLVRVVCKNGDLANIPAEVVAREDAARALSCAAVCVAASLSDPGPAIALAKWRIPLCATFTSGAYEWVDPVASYRSWSLSSAAAALAFALGGSVPVFAPSSPTHVGTTEVPAHGALVTLVVRTAGNSISRVTADTIAGQSHTNYELVVAPTAQALRDACASARGSYIAFLRDGDVLFREGLAALVNALEHSQAALAYGDGLLGYLVDAPGPPVVMGYAVAERMPVSARTMAATDELVGTYFRVLFRRESLVKTGFCEDLDGLVIYDAFLRTLERTAAVRVDEVCGMSLHYLDGRTPGDLDVQYARECESVYARVPAVDSGVSAARAAVLQHLQSHDRIGLRPPPQRLRPPRPISWDFRSIPS
jgi:hypothetical protein